MVLRRDASRVFWKLCKATERQRLSRERPHSKAPEDDVE